VLKERVVAFGPEASLIGIETLPAEDRADARLPGVILLNAGVVHRIGPHRMTVMLARRLAREGFHVLRFDSSGRGDSSPRSRGTPAGAIIADGQAAMDLLSERAGCTRFVFGGLCSGADNSVKIALIDKRVVATILLDPYGYRTPRFYLQRLRDRAADPPLFLRSLQRRLGAGVQAWVARVSADSGRATGDKPPPAYRRKQPDKEVFGTQLRRLADRGVRILVVYTGSASEKYNYAEQFADGFRAFGLDTRVECEFFRDVNHTFTELASQQLLRGRVTEWLTGIFHPVVGRALSATTADVAAPDVAAPDSALPPAPPVSSTAAVIQDVPAAHGHAREAEAIPDGQIARPVDAGARSSPGGLPGAALREAPGVRRLAIIQRQMEIVQSQMQLVGRLRALRGRPAAEQSRKDDVTSG
jgi:hypothetical protein